MVGGLTEGALLENGLRDLSVTGNTSPFHSTSSSQMLVLYIFNYTLSLKTGRFQKLIRINSLALASIVVVKRDINSNVSCCVQHGKRC